MWNILFFKSFGQHLRLHEFVQTFAFSAITALILAGAFSYTVLQASAGHLQIGDIALYLGAVGQAQDRVMGLTTVDRLTYLW